MIMSCIRSIITAFEARQTIKVASSLSFQRLYISTQASRQCHLFYLFFLTNPTSTMPTVLIIGATGNIGTSAVIAALNLDYHVLAVVRNKDSADKLLTRVGTTSGITTVEADILSDKGVQSVVEKVRKGDLPAFQHVYSAGKSIDRWSLTTRSCYLWFMRNSWWPFRHDFYTRPQDGRHQEVYASELRAQPL